MTAAAVRAFSDANSARIAAAASSGQQIIASVGTVTPGGASDGNAAVTVLWRGTVCSVAGYLAHYTPVAGHRVLCAYIDNQLIITGRIIGQP